MKMLFLFCILLAGVSQLEAETFPQQTKSNFANTQHSHGKDEFGSYNSLSSSDVIKDSKKYVSNVYKNVIKRHIEDPSTSTASSFGIPGDRNKTYPGYHETQNIMVIPPRNSRRKYRTIENYGTINELDTKDKKIRNDTFGNNAYQNLLTSMYIWKLLKSLKQNEHYEMYHYFNRPDTMPTETRIPAAQIDICERNSTDLCLEGHIPICIKGEIIYCTVEFSEAVDCSSKYTRQYCAKAKIPCMDNEDSSCEETLLIPCLTKVSVDLRAIGVYLRYCGVTYSVKKLQSGKTDYSKNSLNLKF